MFTKQNSQCLPKSKLKLQVTWAYKSKILKLADNHGYEQTNSLCSERIKSIPRKGKVRLIAKVRGSWTEPRPLRDTTTTLIRMY